MTISLKQVAVLGCHHRVHCATCRTDADWRERVTGIRHFDCPFDQDGKRDLPPEIEQRMSTCSECEHCCRKPLVLAGKAYVGCTLAGCGNLNLETGKCKENKW